MLADVVSVFSRVVRNAAPPRYTSSCSTRFYFRLKHIASASAGQNRTSIIKVLMRMYRDLISSMLGWRMKNRQVTAMPTLK